MVSEQIPTNTDVLIVGAGPVGLALALELGLRGVNVVVVEKSLRKGLQPRAKTTNVRTMQHMRRWGIADALRRAAPLPQDYPTDIVFATSLFGRTLAVIENAFEGKKTRDPRFPEPAQWVPQYVVERVLREKLAQLPSVLLSHGIAFEAASQTEAAVAASVRDLKRDASQKIVAKFLVGADGARSLVRKVIGAAMIGDHTMARHYNVILRVPELTEQSPARRAIMYWLINSTAPSVLGRLERDLWTFGITLPPDVESIEDEEVIRRAQAAIGRTMAIEIAERDVWSAHRLVADSYRNSRMFIAGDACHLHPPFGGYGMNLGVGDAVDLGWKIAAVLKGWGGPKLLESYASERRPVHLRTIAEAVENYATLSAHLIRPELECDSSTGATARREIHDEIVAKKSREFRTLGVVLGSNYKDSPVIWGDGSKPPNEHFSNYEASAHPGCLAPHAWLNDGSSLYDHFGQELTLLVLDDTAIGPAREIERTAATARVPLKRLDIRDPEISRLYAAPLALVRPDQFVAWRGAKAVPAKLIKKICGH